MKFLEKAKNILEWIACILIAFILALLVRYYIGTPTIVKMPSMYPTLKPNQRLVLNRIMRTIDEFPSRGDIVTFEAPTDDSYIFKDEFNANDVVAKYSNEPKSSFDKFVYYVLEINKESYIKRVIALPGEHIHIANGKVYINGVELEEEYLPDNTYTDVSNAPYYNLIVPDNCVFVMGDNRDESTDSRRFGCIPIEKLEGKVWIRFWPLNLFGKIDS